MAAGPVRTIMDRGVVHSRDPSSTDAGTTRREIGGRQQAGEVPRRPTQPPRRALSGPVRLGDAPVLGLTRHELSSARWQRPGRGVRLHQSLDATDPVLRIAALFAWLPEWAVLGGWASLRAQGVAFLDGRTGPGGRTLLPILVHIGPNRHLRPREGLIVDRSLLAPSDVVEVGGRQVTSGTRAVFDEMCRGGVEHGMVVGDAAWACRRTTGPDVVDYVTARPGARGVPAARAAAVLLSPYVKSATESRLRYVWVVEAGLPVPEVNRGLTDGDGFFVGEPDLLDLEAGLVGEYDGSDHRTLARHTADNAREEAFERLNLTVVRATSVDLWPRRAQLVARLLDGYTRGRARDRSRDAWGVRAR
jgi:hypothetical protein